MFGEPPRRGGAQRGAGLAHPQGRRAEVFRRRRFRQHTVDAVLDELDRRRVGVVDHDAGHAEPRRFDHDLAVALTPRRKDHAQGAAERGVERLGVDESAHRQRRLGRGGALECGPLRAIAKGLGAELRDALPCPGQSRAERVGALLADQPAREDHDVVGRQWRGRGERALSDRQPQVDLIPSTYSGQALRGIDTAVGVRAV